MSSKPAEAPLAIGLAAEDWKTTCRHCEKKFSSRTKMMKHIYSDICRTTIPAQAHAILQDKYDALLAEQKQHAVFEEAYVQLLKDEAASDTRYSALQGKHTALQKEHAALQVSHSALRVKSAALRKDDDALIARLRRERDSARAFKLTARLSVIQENTSR